MDTTSTTATIAETVTTAPTADLGPLLAYLAPVVVVLVIAVLFKGLKLIAKKANVETQLEALMTSDRLDRIIDEATKYAVSNLKDANWLKIETKNKAIGFAANYAAEHGAEVITKMGLSPEKLQQKLEAKLLDHDKAPGLWQDDTKTEVK